MEGDVARADNLHYVQGVTLLRDLILHDMRLEVNRVDDILPASSLLYHFLRSKSQLQKSFYYSTDYNYNQ